MVAPVRSALVADQSQLVKFQAQFLAMLPGIRRQAHRAYLQLDPELRDELVAEVVAFAYCAFAGLARRRRLQVAYPTPLGSYAIRRVCSGRKAASRMNRNDALSYHRRRLNGRATARFDRCDEASGHWSQL